jgi:hypothetical protein
MWGLKFLAIFILWFALINELVGRDEVNQLQKQELRLNIERLTIELGGM